MDDEVEEDEKDKEGKDDDEVEKEETAREGEDGWHRALILFEIHDSYGKIKTFL